MPSGERAFPPAQAVTVSVVCAAPAAVVFALLKDGSTWPSWSIFGAFELERRGRGDPLGVGAVRVFSTKLSRAREEVVDIVDCRLLSYRLLSGLPLRDYVAKVALSEGGGLTLIEWSATFGPQPFGTRTVWQLFVRWLLRRTSRDLAREAERLHGNRVHGP